jgi:hypothetical protein
MLGRVILSRAHGPRARLAFDMNLTRGVPIAHKPRRKDRDRVLTVIDVRYVGRRVDVVRKMRVPDAWHAETDHT